MRVCTAWLSRSTGAPVRVLKNRMAREYVRMEKDHLPLEELEKLTLGSLRKAVQEGDIQNGTVMAGQIAGMIHDIRSCKEIVESINSQCEALLHKNW